MDDYEDLDDNIDGNEELIEDQNYING